MIKAFLTERFALSTLVATSLLGAEFSSMALAQNAPDPLAARTQKRVASLFQSATKGVREMGLSAGQQAKLKSIAQKNAPLARAIWSDGSLTPMQKAVKIRALQNEASAVFTPVQKQKLAAAKTEAMMQLFQTASWVSDELRLSDPQKDKIQDIVMKNYRQSKSAAGSFGALRSLLLDTNNQIDAALTPSQKMKWNTIKRAARAEFTKNARVLRVANGV